VCALRRPKVQVSRWWTLPPVVIVLAFNILLERKRPVLPGLVHFLILIVASVISFGVTFSVVWLIGRLRDPWKKS
jgi:hypothetical protein